MQTWGFSFAPKKEDRSMTFLAISIGAVLGANARYLVGGWVADRLGSAFPYGTLVINVSGSFLLGLTLAVFAEHDLGPVWLRTGLAVGLIGTYTTFSTFGSETMALITGGDLAAATLNIAASLAGSLVGVYLGILAARLV
jgi:CrcB protein